MRPLRILPGLIVTMVLLGTVLATCQAFGQTIPRAAQAHKRELTAQARLIWGLDAPLATFAAQIHQESLWRADVQSLAGAQGIAQFMPATGLWLSQTYRSLGAFEPFNPVWGMRALARYDLHLYAAIDAIDSCERMAKTLSAYNGGLTWLRRDERLAAQVHLDASRWFGNVETVNAGRAAWAIKENRNYPRRILLELEPFYLDAGFIGGMCDDRR